MKFCVDCGTPRAIETAKFCGECGAAFTPSPALVGLTSTEAVEIASKIINSALGAEAGFDAAASAELFTPAVLALSDQGWDALHILLRSWEGRMDRNLDGALNAAGVLESVAVNVDPVSHLAVKARALGLASAVPFPEWNGMGTWDEQSDLWRAELRFLNSYFSYDWPLTVLDLSYLSDYARSAGGRDLFYDSELAADPLGQFQIHLPGPGAVLHSMTAVALLAASDEVGAATNAQINAAGVLINPRLLHLFCDEGNVIEPWWTEMLPWDSIITTWKDLNDGAFDPGFNDQFILEQLQRSTTWGLYANPDNAAKVRQDQVLFDNLIEYIESCRG